MTTAPRRRRPSLLSLALVCIVVAYALPVSGLGWNQGSHYALVRALADGTARIDDDRFLTGDVSWDGEHFYSTKAPGLALVTLPVYLVLDATGARSALEGLGDSRREDARLVVWALGLWGVVLPAALLLILVHRLGERLEPGSGGVAAAVLGAATLVLPFATVFFAHVLSALLGFAAFALLVRERSGLPRYRLVLAAGLLAGLAVTTEYTLLLVAVALGAYALVRSDGRLQRGLAYGIGACVGVAPLVAYNWWAFGSPTRLSYEDAVLRPGESGHDVLGANTEGIFGVGVPDPRVAAELLFASRGLLTTAPVLAVGLLGLVILVHRGRRAEAILVGALAAAFLVFNAGYFLPLGGNTPGPRFLVPLLPFAALAVGLAYRRLPGTTLALAAASSVVLAAATFTFPLLPGGRTGEWADRIVAGEFRDTILTFAGVGTPWLAILPAALALATAVVLAGRAFLPAVLERDDGRAGVAALAVWTVVAVAVPRAGADPGSGAAALVLAGAAAGVLVLAGIHAASLRRSQRPQPAADDGAAGSS